MVYLSQLLNRDISFQDKKVGTVIDLGVMENRPTPPISRIVVRQDKRKITLSPSAVTFKNNKFTLNTPNIPFLPYDEKDFFLSEDLLDKQVIDVDGRRVVRVNDVLLENNGELKVMGIDVGPWGILRRLGADKFFPLPLKSKTLPWSLIQAFDYQTGAIQLRISQNRLNTFHPAEIAEILEDVGTKERLGIVNVLDAQKAAIAIETADSETQVSILEALSPIHLKDIVNKMLVSELADIFYRLNHLRTREIAKLLGSEKIDSVKTLTKFSDDVAGGLMRLSYFQVNSEKTVKEVHQLLNQEQIRPEAIVVTNGNERVIGTILLKDLLLSDPLALLKDIVAIKIVVYPYTSFSQILRLFSDYNLRVLPVVDKEKQLLGVVTIDTILEKIHQEEEKNDIL